MKRIILIFLSLSIFGVTTSFGQIDFISNSQQLLSDAVKTGLFLSRQSFQVCDANGDLYGLHGKDEFGVSYSLGVKVPGGILLTDSAVRPWEYNNEYPKYKDEYSPIFYEAKYSSLKDSISYDSLEYSLAVQEELVDTTLYRLASDSFAGKGFVIDTTDGEKDGWIVWVAPDEGDNYEDVVNWQYSIYRKEISIDKDETSFEIVKPGIFKTVLGGIFVVPVYPEIGVVEFRLCGVIVPAGDKWKLWCPFIGKMGAENAGPDDSKPNPSSAKPDDGKPELTPVGGMTDNTTGDPKKKKTK